MLLNPTAIDQRIGWRLAFGAGALLAFAILFVRRAIPESPRWLLTHGRSGKAEHVTLEIEERVRRDLGKLPHAEPRGDIVIDTDRRHGLIDVWRTMLRTYPQRTIVALSLMISQAFLYNAIFFTEALVLATFFNVAPDHIGYYIFPFAVGNLLGPLVLGHLFDVVGRKPMIAGTYALSGVLLLVTGVLFVRGALDARSMTICWCVVFFFASAGASAAYLTVSETFPLEIRAMAIALVYAIGTLAGGALAPALFGALIATKSPGSVFDGYLVGALAMIAAAAIELTLGIEAGSPEARGHRRAAFRELGSRLQLGRLPDQDRGGKRFEQHACVEPAAGRAAGNLDRAAGEPFDVAARSVAAEKHALVVEHNVRRSVEALEQTAHEPRHDDGRCCRARERDQMVGPGARGFERAIPATRKRLAMLASQVKQAPRDVRLHRAVVPGGEQFRGEARDLAARYPVAHRGNRSFA